MDRACVSAKSCDRPRGTAQTSTVVSSDGVNIVASHVVHPELGTAQAEGRPGTALFDVALGVQGSNGAFDSVSHLIGTQTWANTGVVALTDNLAVHFEGESEGSHTAGCEATAVPNEGIVVVLPFRQYWQVRHALLLGEG